jgi:hypothetical protein
VWLRHWVELKFGELSVAELCGVGDVRGCFGGVGVWALLSLTPPVNDVFLV